MHIDFPAWAQCGGRVLSPRDRRLFSCGHETQHCLLIHTAIWHLLFKYSFFLPLLPPINNSCWSPSFPGSKTNIALAIPVTLQTPHLHRARLWGKEASSILCHQKEVPKLCHTTSWRGIKGHFAAVRLTDQLPGTAGSTSCTPGQARAVHWVFTAWISWPCCYISFLFFFFFLEILYLSAFKALYLFMLVQAHRTRRVFCPAGRQVSVWGGEFSTSSYSNGSVDGPPLSPLWHHQWCVQVTQRLAIISKLSVNKSW